MPLSNEDVLPTNNSSLNSLEIFKGKGEEKNQVILFISLSTKNKSCLKHRAFQSVYE